MNNKAYYCDIKTSSYLCPFDDEHKISEEEYRQALEDMKKYS